nr:MAG TPA: hypothetical protein [Caudoviricetes sp.]
MTAPLRGGSFFMRVAKLFCKMCFRVLTFAAKSSII